MRVKFLNTDVYQEFEGDINKEISGLEKNYHIVDVKFFVAAHAPKYNALILYKPVGKELE